MFRLFIVLLLAFTGIKALAVDGDFSGQYRFRTGVSNSSPNVGGLFTEIAKDKWTKLDIRASVSGSFRPSESFEGNSTLYLNLGKADGITPMAYGDWMISDELMLRVGRSTYEIADGSVIGINDYEYVPLYFDGLFLTHSSESFGIDFIVADAELKGDGYPDPPMAIVSLDARSFPELVKTANIHFIIPVFEYTKARAGVTIGGGAMGFGYRMTVATSSIKGVGMANLLFDGKLSYTFEMDSSALKFYLGGHVDGSEYDAFFYNKHKNAGKMDLVRWGKGLQYAKGGLSYWMDSDLGMGLVGYYFLKAGAANKDNVTLGDKAWK